MAFPSPQQSLQLPPMSLVKHKSDCLKVSFLFCFILFPFNDHQWHPFVEGRYRHSLVISQSSLLFSVNSDILKGHGWPDKLGKPCKQITSHSGWVVPNSHNEEGELEWGTVPKGPYSVIAKEAGCTNGTHSLASAQYICEVVQQHRCSEDIAPVRPF